MKHTEIKNGGKFGLALNANHSGILFELTDKNGVDHTRVLLRRDEITDLMMALANTAKGLAATPITVRRESEDAPTPTTPAGEGN